MATRDLTIKIGSDVGGATAGLKAVQAQVNGLTKAIDRQLKYSAVAAAGAFGVMLYKTTQFRQAMAAVQAVSGATSNELRALEQTARSVGKDVAGGAVAAAEGLKILAQAGFSAAESAAALPGVVALAKTEGMALGDATQYASDTLRGFQMDASDAGRVADVLAKMSAASSVSVADLGMSFSYAAGASQIAGVKFEEAAAALAAMGNQGIRGSRGGSALRAILSALASPSKEATEAMKALGVQYGSTELRARGLIGYLEELEKAAARGGDVAGAIYASFRENAATALFSMLNVGSAKVREFATQARNAKGAAQEMAAVMESTLAGSLDRVMARLQDTGISLTSVLEDTLARLLRAVVIPLLDEMNEKLQAIAGTTAGDVAGKIVDAFSAAAAAAGDLAQGILYVAKGLSVLKGVGGGVWSGLQGMKETVAATWTGAQADIAGTVRPSSMDPAGRAAMAEVEAELRAKSAAHLDAAEAFVSAGTDAMESNFEATMAIDRAQDDLSARVADLRARIAGQKGGIAAGVAAKFAPQPGAIDYSENLGYTPGFGAVSMGPEVPAAAAEARKVTRRALPSAGAEKAATKAAKAMEKAAKAAADALSDEAERGWGELASAIESARQRAQGFNEAGYATTGQLVAQSQGLEAVSQKGLVWASMMADGMLTAEEYRSMLARAEWEVQHLSDAMSGQADAAKAQQSALKQGADAIAKFRGDANEAAGDVDTRYRKGLLTDETAAMFSQRVDDMRQRANDLFAALKAGGSREDFESGMQRLGEDMKDLNPAMDGLNAKIRDVGGAIQQFLIGGFTLAIETMADMLASAMGLMDQSIGSIAKAAMGTLGGMFVQLGSALIAAGMGIEALKMLLGAAAVPAGIGLIAIGKMMQAYAGGGGGGEGARAGASGGGGGVGSSMQSYGSAQTSRDREREPTTVVINYRSGYSVSDKRAITRELGTLMRAGQRYHVRMAR